MVMREVVQVARGGERVPMEIIKRQVVHFYHADSDYGIGVATRMGPSAGDLPSMVAAEQKSCPRPKGSKRPVWPAAHRAYACGWRWTIRLQIRARRSSRALRRAVT
jgi:hypothetical protein